LLFAATADDDDDFDDVFFRLALLSAPAPWNGFTFDAFASFGDDEADADAAAAAAVDDDDVAFVDLVDRVDIRRARSFPTALTTTPNRRYNSTWASNRG
jgi:hypothetical protein